MYEPIIQDGFVEILIGKEFKKIGIHHAHLEEDAGKLTHPDGADYSLVDYNRAGTPLVEIVSEPDINSPEEAKRYLQEIYNIVTALGVCNGDMEHGNFKFDLNVSVSDSEELGTRTELKNLNSFRNAERALKYEIQRQIDLLESGEKVKQETRGWNDAKSKTFSQRSKEEANDYRYFPEPDIPPLNLSNDFISEIQKEIEALPSTIRRELYEIGLSVDDQDLLISQPKTAKIFQDARVILKNEKLIKKAVNWLVGDFQALGLDDRKNLTGNNLAELVKLIDDEEISSKIGKEIFVEVCGGEAPSKIIDDRGLVQVSDDTELEKIITEIIKNNPKPVEDYKSGSEKVLGFFVGQVMKETKGQANPSKVNELVVKLLKG
jgi:aspartyl-tRNA(Asn)/glutamyl-tRNA(Gln) amidotransferase subunit B